MSTIIIITLEISMLTIQRLLFTDTDTLMYKIKAEAVYEDFLINKETFDFSYYSAE